MSGEDEEAEIVAEDDVISTPAEQDQNSGHIEISAQYKSVNDHSDTNDEPTSFLSFRVPLREGGNDNGRLSDYNETSLFEESMCLQSPLKRNDDLKNAESRESSSWSEENLATELPSTYSITDEASGASRSQVNVLQLGQSSNELPSSQSYHIIHTPRMDNSSNSRENRPPVDATNKDEHVEHQAGEQSTADILVSHETVTESPEHAIKCTPKEQQIIPQSDVYKGNYSKQQSSSGEQLQCSNVVQHPSTLYPPMPATTEDPVPSSFVTSSLQTLKDMPRLRDRFSKFKFGRILRPCERGYWEFDTTGRHWTVDHQQDMWRLLAKTVQTGVAGWGVWCVRSPIDGGTGIEQFGSVKLFCWGEIVEHCYLLLYTVSNSAVKKSNPVWRDADGTAVVTM